LIAIPAIRGGSLEKLDHLLPLLEKELARGDSWALVAVRWAQGFLGAIRHGAQARSATAEGWLMARRLAKRGERPPGWIEGWAYMSLARSHDRWGEWRRTLRYAGSSLGIYQRNDDRYGMAASYVTLAAGYYGLGEYKAAMEQCRRCLELATEAEDPRWHSEALYVAGQVDLESGDLAGALEHGRQVVAVAGRSGDMLRQGLGHLLLARVALRQGEPQAAVPVLRQLEAQAQAADGLAYRVLMRRYLAEAFLLLDNHPAAQKAAREGIQWAEHCAMKREQGNLNRILGLALAAEGQTAAGRGEIEKALVLARRIASPHDLALAQGALDSLSL
jgi:tetratricopeptide (TPR) repeat protein